MEEPEVVTQRESQIARVFRPLGRGPMRREQALRAAQILGVHWTTLYRMRARSLRDPRTSSLIADPGGRKRDPQRLVPEVEAVVSEVVERWLPRQSALAHPILDTHMEVRTRCTSVGLKPPSRNTIPRRMEAHRQAELALLQLVAGLHRSESVWTREVSVEQHAALFGAESSPICASTASFSGRACRRHPGGRTPCPMSFKS